MDSVFLLGEGDRAAFFQHLIRSFGCLHICLWSHLPQPSNCLLAIDGLYHERSSQNPSSSSGSLSRRLFNAYKESVNYVDAGRIPGFAFKNNVPYMKLTLHELQRMASHDLQLQFYQEAGVKAVVFMGCAAGEIELGLSNENPQVDIEKEMKNMFPVDFSRVEIPPSSSSSSLKSLSVDSSEYSYSYSPLFFNINPTTATEPNLREALLEDALVRSIPLSTPPITTAEIEDATMANAMLAVLTSTSTSTSSSRSRSNSTAFVRYNRRAALAPIAGAHRRQNMFKRSVSFFRKLSMTRRDSATAAQGENRPTPTQMRHMISERQRREKLNESFKTLRTLLPSGTKRDKASLLSSTTEYLSSLKAQVAELSKRNEALEAQLIAGQRSSRSFRQDDRGVDQTNVEIVPVSSSAPSTSEASRLLDMRVRVRLLGEGNSMLDLVIRILDFLRQQRNVSLSWVESNTAMFESSTPVHEITMRLKIEGDELDESTLGAAVRRIVDDRPR